MDTSSKTQKEDQDRLTDLPIEIIHSILTLIPIREAGRTCVLSTKWRYTWTTLPYLAFDCSSDDEEEEPEEMFINQVLSRHKGPINKFELYYPTSDLTYFDEWMFRLSRNGIQELILYMYRDGFPLLNLRSTIYSCKKLACLRLFGCELDPPPLTIKGFFFLRILSLHGVKISSDGIYSLVAVCPHLEELELIEMYTFELKISAPNLKFMYLEGSYDIIRIDAPLVTVLSIELRYYNDEDLENKACDYAKCFGGFTNLQKLFGFDLFTKYLSLGIHFSHHTLVFHHLKLICLEGVNFEDVKEVLVVAYLVIGAPNLQKLRIKTRHEPDLEAETLPLSFRGLGCPSNFKLEKLTDVTLMNVEGLGIEFLIFLLESSPVLATMTVGLEDKTEEKWNNLRAKLKGCNHASPNVKFWKKKSLLQYEEINNCCPNCLIHL